jgi:hypothetical protein
MPEILNQVFVGGAMAAQIVRAGAGGTAASGTVTDSAGTPANIVTVTAKYAGTRGTNLSVKVQTNPSDGTKKDAIVLDGTTQVESFTFAAPARARPTSWSPALAGSAYVTASKIAAGNGVAKTGTYALSGGVNPTVAAGDYTTALALLEPTDVVVNVVVTDSEATAVHTALTSWVDRVRNDGKRLMGVAGEPTSVLLATRQSDAAALNHPAVVYAGNGFSQAGVAYEGYKAAARLAAMIASAPYTKSLTRAVVTGATGVVGALTESQLVDSINKGMAAFRLNPLGQVVVHYGITTLVTLTGQLDAGWKKIRRVRTRDAMIDRIVLAIDPLIGLVNNDDSGRGQIIAAAQQVLNAMVAEGGLKGGTVAPTIKIDPANPPAGDQAWFVVTAYDNDSAEHVYAAFGLAFTTPS